LNLEPSGEITSMLFFRLRPKHFAGRKRKTPSGDLYNFPDRAKPGMVSTKSIPSQDSAKPKPNVVWFGVLDAKFYT
jgi:hypothetical protein